jgi:hypothetical protein
MAGKFESFSAPWSFFFLLQSRHRVIADQIQQPRKPLWFLKVRPSKRFASVSVEDTVGYGIDSEALSSDDSGRSRLSRFYLEH